MIISNALFSLTRVLSWETPASRNNFHLRRSVLPVTIFLSVSFLYFLLCNFVEFWKGETKILERHTCARSTVKHCTYCVGSRVPPPASNKVNAIEDNGIKNVEEGREEERVTGKKKRGVKKRTREEKVRKRKKAGSRGKKEVEQCPLCSIERSRRLVQSDEEDKRARSSGERSRFKCSFFSSEKDNMYKTLSWRLTSSFFLSFSRFSFCSFASLQVTRVSFCFNCNRLTIDLYRALEWYWLKSACVWVIMQMYVFPRVYVPRTCRIYNACVCVFFFKSVQSNSNEK